MSKIAFIAGITGQDGAYLAEFLLNRNYIVHGMVRSDAVDGTERLQERGLLERVRLHHGDIADAANVIGSGNNVTIAELARMVADVVGFKGDIAFDRSKPDGTPAKLMDSSRIFTSGWRPVHRLKEGLEKTYVDYIARPKMRMAA